MSAPASRSERIVSSLPSPTASLRSDFGITGPSRSSLLYGMPGRLLRPNKGSMRIRWFDRKLFVKQLLRQSTGCGKLQQQHKGWMQQEAGPTNGWKDIPRRWANSISAPTGLSQMDALGPRLQLNRLRLPPRRNGYNDFSPKKRHRYPPRPGLSPPHQTLLLCSSPEIGPSGGPRTQGRRPGL